MSIGVRSRRPVPIRVDCDPGHDGGSLVNVRGVAAVAVALSLTAGSVPAMGAPGPSSPPSPTTPRSGVFVQVTPDTVQPDYLVGIEASCGDDNSRSASVESAAFGRVTVRPQNGALTASATVPANRRADTYRVHLTCRNRRTATTTLRVLGNTRPSRGPATGFGGTAGGGSATVLITGGLLAIAAGLGLFTLRRRRVP
jgi:hypothetical protein